MHKKYPLVFATMVAFLSVCTAGVSTFAWFQASAQVQISTTSSSTSISVSKGLDYSLYAYVGNYKDGDTSKAVCGYSSSTPTETFNSDFYLLDTDAKVNAGIADISNLTPGKRLTYCLAVTNVSKSHVKLDITRFTSQEATDANTSNRARIVNGSSTIYIEMGWAINIYGDYSSDLTNYTRHISKTAISNGAALSDKFNYTAGTAITKVTDHVYSDVSLNVIDCTSISSSACYLFYSVEFANENTTYFYEVNDSSERIYEERASGTRKFVKNTGGDSSCYEGLSFSLNKISVTEADS